MGNRTENKGTQKGWDARQLDVRMLSLRLNEFILVLYNINHIKNTSYIFTFHITRSTQHFPHLRLFPTTIHYRGTKSTRTRLLLIPSLIPAQSTTSVLKSHINTAHTSYSPLAPILTTSSPEPSNHRHRFPSAFAPPPHPMFCFGSGRLSSPRHPPRLAKNRFLFRGRGRQEVQTRHCMMERAVIPSSPLSPLLSSPSDLPLQITDGTRSINSVRIPK